MFQAGAEVLQQNSTNVKYSKKGMSELKHACEVLDDEILLDLGKNSPRRDSYGVHGHIVLLLTRNN